MLKKIREFLRVVRMAYCRHDFAMMDNEFNRSNHYCGCTVYYYKCRKCGKIVRMDVSHIGQGATGWNYGIRKRL